MALAGRNGPEWRQRRLLGRPDGRREPARPCLRVPLRLLVRKGGDGQQARRESFVPDTRRFFHDLGGALNQFEVGALHEGRGCESVIAAHDVSIFGRHRQAYFTARAAAAAKSVPRMSA